MPDDLRSRLAAHPLLDELTNRQLDAIVEVADGGPPAEPHLPAEDELWHGSGQHTVRVLAYVPKVVTYLVLTVPDGRPAGHHAGPWQQTLHEFLEAFTYREEP